ncbi:hypothetical protein FGE12_02615 [Aggregicoccus sp. 17bor-14]|uniref:alpha-2-macroglobulin family protein n=1 Tax=Myxococcaceae TaxID=31 RepID=UPI00129C78B5|nr:MULTISPECIES: alpha-2-macroglobulin family protein [Myxococcaceae]MBF5041263.1 hypothetical protein [Simulacricoccus sp. 17bor-14]MRI87049.1 hypothetical protein [Aggregicoccus sp. 17bor-14]
MPLASRLLTLLLLALFVLPLAAAAQGRLPSWKQIDGLIDEQKFEEAARATEARLAAARKGPDEAEWTRALIQTVQLRIGLHGYETAVRFLREEPWPKGAVHRAALQLFYASSLVQYAQAYGWEIQQRERVASSGPVDLKSWTREQLDTEAQRAFFEVWKGREALGTEPVTVLERYVRPNTYPPGIRGTLRDAVTYLWVAQLADSSAWRPEHASGVHRLSLPALLEGTPQVDLVDPAVHPLLKLASLLGDLEAWHAGAGRKEAALEAALTREARLHDSLTEQDDRAGLRRHLEARLLKDKALPWSAMGLGQLAQQEREADQPVRARAHAREGLAAFPKSEGAKRCAALVRELEAPDFSLSTMVVDGQGKRSVEVTHRNLPAVFFRTYAFDLEARLRQADDYNLLPYGEDLQRLMAASAPAAQWRQALPSTPDLRSHRTFVVPPKLGPGMYLLVASAREDFRAAQNPVLGSFFTVGRWVLVSHEEQGERIAVRVLEGETGKPAPGVEVRLVVADYQRHHHEAQSQKSDAQGELTFLADASLRNRGLFLVAGRGREAELDPGTYTLYERGLPGTTTQALVFTDRSVYRPQQRVLWKAVLFEGRGDQARYRTVAQRTLTVSLMDPNNQTVETRTVTTNAFGSAAGEFTVPTGRLLGAWRVQTSVGGAAPVRVEEYKRPTFEVTLAAPTEPLRLNRIAHFRGEARYYFGLPVASGAVRWRVTRVPVLPWWGYYRSDKVGGTGEVVATGSASLGADGSFPVDFTPEADVRQASAKDVTYRYRLDADVTDEGGETRSAERIFRLGFVAVEARVDSDVAFLREGERGQLRLLRSDLDGSPRPGAGHWTLSRLTAPATPLLPAEEPVEPPPVVPGGEPRATTPGDSLRPRWTTDYDPIATLRRWAAGKELAHGDVTHDAQGVATLELPTLPSGAYRLTYETKDAFGARFTVSREYLVAGKDAGVGLPALMQLERTALKVGDRARVLALSGFEGQPLFLEVMQAGRVVERRTVLGKAGQPLVELPVTEALRGGFTVSVTAVRDYQAMRFSETVLVPYDDKELKVEFATFRDKLRPGSKETWRVTVRGPDGAKVGAGAAELLAYMYDQSLDLFAQHSPPSPLAYYPQRGQGSDTRVSLGQANAMWIRGPESSPEGWSMPEGDTLRFFENYGIGGPGRRAYGRVMAEPMMAGAPPPPPPSPAKVARSTSAENAMEDKSQLKQASVQEALAPAPAPELRSNFAETAFWVPQLLTDKDGSATLEFTVPDSVTAWSVWVHALTRDFQGGSVNRKAQSVKELMVRPYLPRFLREGDQAVLEVVVNNAGSSAMSGTLQLEVLDPERNVSVAQDFGLRALTQPFTVAAGKGTSLRFPLTAPRRVGTVAFKVTATAGAFSDGELRPLPVLPGRMHLQQSRFVTLRNADRKEMRFADLERTDDPTRIDEQLVVTVDAQLFYSVLQALPYLVNYPYECTEQTLNRFVSTGIVTSLFDHYPAVARMAKELSTRDTRLETWDAADPNRKMALEETPWLQEAQGGRDPGAPLVKVLDPRVAKAERDSALAKLQKAQTSSGGFPWWAGGPPSPYMTLYIVHGLARAAEHGVQVPRDVTQRAWAYLARHYREQYAGKLAKQDTGWEFVTFLNYVASTYPDPSYTGDALTAKEREQMLAFSFKHWKQHSPYLKGYLALTLHRAGRTKDAQLVWDSVMDSAKTTEELGTFWAPEDRGWLWYNDTTETHAIALQTLSELRPKDPRRDGLVQWLLLDKKLNHWKSTRATAEVIYALVKYLEKEGALGIREEARVSVAGQTTQFVFEPDQYTGKKNQVVVPAERLKPGMDSRVVVEKGTKGLAFASATWSFSTERLPEEARGDFFQVTRRYFKRERSGTEAVLRPLEEGARLEPGDEVEVQLSLRAKHAAEYVHLRDPRAAGLEPETAVSRHKWDLGIVWYEETRDSGTNFFFEWLPAGEYTFKYRLRANMAGTFKVGPATVQSMYAPEFNAYSAGATLGVGTRP